MFKKSLALLPLIGLLILTSCGAPVTTPSGQLETVVASTLQAYTQTAPTLAPLSGSTTIAEGLTLTIPTGLATGIISTTEAAVPPADDMPWWGIYPEHKIYSLQGYVLSDTFHEPRIFKFPVSEYEAMNEDVGGRIQVLKNILSNPSQPIPEKLPFLPTWNAGEVFHSNVQSINFQNGSGVRYLTQYGQFPAPVSNSEIFYTFQGLTNDGMYYISAVLPISIGFLTAQASPDSPVPPDGIPFDWNDYTNNEGHYKAIIEKLNTADPNAFNPALPLLDALIQSILSQ